MSSSSKFQELAQGCVPFPEMPNDIKLDYDWKVDPLGLRNRDSEREAIEDMRRRTRQMQREDQLVLDRLQELRDQHEKKHKEKQNQVFAKAQNKLKRKPESQEPEAEKEILALDKLSASSCSSKDEPTCPTATPSRS